MASRKNKNTILSFINVFKSKYPKEITDVFYNGYCYYFALMLQARFGGELFFNPNLVHFAVLINGYLFDIRGKVNLSDDKEWYNWEDFQRNNDVTKVIHSCILKS